MGFLPWEIWVAFSGESQRRQSRTTQPTVHTGCFSVSISHHTLTWTTGSLTCAHMLMHAIAHRNVRTHVRESALKVDSWRKSHAAPGNQTCVSGLLFATELRPHPSIQVNVIGLVWLQLITLAISECGPSPIVKVLFGIYQSL